MKNLLIILGFLLLTTGCNQENGISFKSNYLEIDLDKKGIITALIDSSGINYVPLDQQQPLLQLRIANEYIYPEAAELSGNTLVLSYPGRSVTLTVDQKESHVRFEIIQVEPMEGIELAVWGPIHTSIDSVIGETVGVVRGPEYAIGIQSLNVKTLGGYPWQENDCMPEIDIFESDNYTDLSEEGKRMVLYRVEAAKPTDFGSSLQAFVRNRTQDRIIENLNHDFFEAPAYDDGGLVGSAIALFGAPTDRALEFIGKIEIEEDLPHPTIDGVWSKQTAKSAAAYLIIGFGEEDAQKAIDYTKKAGLQYLDHPGPFETWGHFQWNKSFPKGLASMKNVVDLAESQGIHVGVHTLSNFITTNDSYVTPVPDDRLAIVGRSELVSPIGEEQTEIEVKSPKFFDQFRNNSLRTIRIGNELIRYGSVSKSAPWILTDCQRGAFGTTVSDHLEGAEVTKLADHGYKVFLTNTELTIELSERIADLFNETGLRQISFDGLEGNRSTGMGTYGETLMPVTWYNRLNDNIKSHYIADASRTTHFFWHIYSRMNWGEPWYAGFRESQTEYRMKNQKYFQRNMMPGMLGWFLMRTTTSLEDMEWLLAKSGGFDAGYSFVCDYEALDNNGQTDTILALIGQYESLRMSNAFSEKQKELMRDINLEFSLDFKSETDWELYQYHVERAVHTSRKRQPGEPLWSEISMDNPYENQRLMYLITAPEASDIRNITLELDNYKQIELPIRLKKGQILKYEGGENAHVYSSNWELMQTINWEPYLIEVNNGTHQLKIDAQFDSGQGHELKLEFKVKTKTAK